MFFEDFETKTKIFNRKKLKIKGVDAYTPGAVTDFPSASPSAFSTDESNVIVGGNGTSSSNSTQTTKNQALLLKYNNGFKYSVATTNPVCVPYYVMRLDFYYRTEKFESGDTFFVEYSTQIDSPVWEVLFTYSHDDVALETGNGADVAAEEDAWFHQVIEWKKNYRGEILLQFRCESASKKHKVFIDDITLMSRD